MNINKEEITYTFSSDGYMLYFREECIGGSKTCINPAFDRRNKRLTRSNTKLFKSDAEREKERILRICNGSEETYNYYKQFAPFCYIEKIMKKAD